MKSRIYSIVDIKTGCVLNVTKGLINAFKFKRYFRRIGYKVKVSRYRGN